VQGWPDISASAYATLDVTSARGMPYKDEICFPHLTGSYFCSSNCSRLDSVNHESLSLENPIKRHSGSDSWLCTLRNYYF